MSDQPRHTRNNPVSDLVRLSDPEGLLRNPRISRSVTPVVVSEEASTSLFHRELDSFLNPPTRTGIRTLQPSPAVWSPIARQLTPNFSSELSAPPSEYSVNLDQLSVLSPTRPHANLPRPPRRSLPGAFDPNLTIGGSDSELTMNGPPPTNLMDSTSGPHSPQDQQTFMPGAENSAVSQSQFQAETAAMRAEIVTLQNLVRQLVLSKQSDQAPANTGQQGSHQGHNASSESQDGTILQPHFTSTPLDRNPFRVPTLQSVTHISSNQAHPEIHQQPASAIDPIRFRVSDFPEYKGRYGDVSAYRIWRHKVERLFIVKGVMLDSDRFNILPLLLGNDPAASWCRRAGEFVGHSWASAMKELETVILPVDWLDKIKQQIRELSMKPNESMSAFCARARVLQEAAGSDECSEESLAWAIVGGSTSLFRSIQQRDQLVKTSINPVSQQFSFAIFEQRACSTWDFVMEIEAKTRAGSKTQNSNTNPFTNTTSAPAQRTSNRQPLTPEETAARNARFFAYMRSVGLCPRCKTSCKDWQGNCTAPFNQAYVQIPNEFPRQPPYPPPKASNTQPRRNAMVESRPAARRIDVAAVDNDQVVDVAALGEFPDLGREDLRAYEQLLERLAGPEEEDLVDAADGCLSYEPLV
ncbi:uncharacterized protein MELLADRAFT_114204 [Melampsora larici-populina 98AG31]|uniref:Retrotransposon gag domain-containing protein n=1 Tax=Melampsora larici-populina (strain 98AG31 / pathotype 3-4-7) TaxID=747676 RepID=F4SCL4_MELLP|nr:uncharacterized protein MELLADRAFT_114204 [Melampsora larici-populina 98AG31]EGF97616.1 hypothetical protein MELLADRAFT_114204 [Melampsora larici-populina 98AG31]